MGTNSRGMRTHLPIIIHNGRAAPCRKCTRLKVSVWLTSVNARHGMKGMNTGILINCYSHNRLNDSKEFYLVISLFSRNRIKLGSKYLAFQCDAIKIEITKHT